MSLLALRRRSLALWLAGLGAFSLAITYVVPVAATLSAGGKTISPLRVLSPLTLEFPALRVPQVTHTAPAPNAAAISVGTAGTAAPALHGRARRLPVVTNLYVTRPQPTQSKATDSSLPSYEDAVGVAAPAISAPDTRPRPMRLRPLRANR